MIDHCGFSVSDFARAKEFYVRALAPLAYTLIMDVPAEQTELGFAAAGFGRDGKPSFWISGAGRLDPPIHVAIQAKDRSAVDGFIGLRSRPAVETTERLEFGHIIIRITTELSFSMRMATISRPSATMLRRICRLPGAVPAH